MTNRLHLSLLLASVAAMSVGQVFKNASFEDPVHPNGWWDYRPVTTDWSGSTGTWGMASGTGSWGRGAYEGNQYAFLQGSNANNSINQRVSGFTIGTRYRVTFAMARRTGHLGADTPNPVEVFCDSTRILGPYAPPNDQNWRIYETEGFVATKGTHKFTFSATRTGDNTSLIDDLKIEVAPVIPPDGQFRNGSFERPLNATNQWVSVPASSDTIWKGTNSWGVANGSSSWGQGGTEGAQYAYLQASGNNSSIYQTVEGIAVGKVYRVSFMMARRNGNVGGNTGVPLRVLMDDAVVLFPYTSPGSDGQWRRCETLSFMALKDNYKFTWQTAFAGGDQSDLIDEVKIEEVTNPDPPSLINNGFQQPRLAPDTWVANPTGARVGWEGIGWGIANGNTPYGAGGYQSPDYAFLYSKKDAPEIHQNVDNLILGETYEVTFRVARKAGGTPNIIRVKIDGEIVLYGVIGPDGGGWQKRKFTFVATKQSVVLSFNARRSTLANPDQISLLDDIRFHRLEP